MEKKWMKKKKKRLPRRRGWNDSKERSRIVREKFEHGWIVETKLNTNDPKNYITKSSPEKSER